MNLDDYNSDDYKVYLSDDDMQANQTNAEAKANPDYRSPPPPPAVTVTVKLEDEDKEIKKARRRIRNQKRAKRRQRQLDRLHEDVGESHDYSNNDLRNVINIGRDARTVIISKCQEREEAEAYYPSSNYCIIDDDHQKPARKRPNVRAHDSKAGPPWPAPPPQQGR